MRHPLPRFAALACASLQLAAQGSDCDSTNVLTQAIPPLYARMALPGMNVQIARDKVVRYEKVFGSDGTNEVLPIASGSKWLSAACVMSVVDSGKLSLDDKISKYVPKFTGPAANITVRQCLSHTAGFPPFDSALDLKGITLAQCVDYLATLPLESTPGTVFEYGEVSMQVAGRCAEVASGKSWDRLFDDNIANRVGMGRTDYAAFGATANPRIGAGARSSMRDYGAFLRMLAGEGLSGSTRVLAASSVREMLADQTRGAFLKTQPYPGPPRRYGLGCWRDVIAPDGSVLQASSQGVFGFTPWLDLERRLTGVVLVQDLLIRIAPYVDELRRATRDYATPTGAACVGISTYACGSPIVQNALACPRPLDAAFGLVSFGGPPNVAGVTLIGSALKSAGWQFFNVRLYVDVAQPWLALPVLGDADGRSTLALTIPSGLTGQKLHTQFLWPKPSSCGGIPGNGATSNVLTLTLQ